MILAALAVLGSFAGCGKSDNSGSSSSADVYEQSVEKPAHFFKAEYIENLPSELNDTVNTGVFSGNNFYYISWNEDYSANKVCVYDMTSGQGKVINEASRTAADPNEPSRYVSSLNADSQGNVMELISETKFCTDKFDFDMSKITKADASTAMIDNWGYSASDVEKDLADDGKVAKQYTDSEGNVRYDWIYVACVGYDYGTMNKWLVETYDKDGNLKNSVTLSESASEEHKTESVTGIQADKDGNIVCVSYNIEDVLSSSNEDNTKIKVFDAAGKMLNEFQSADIDSSSMLMSDNDGKLMINQWGDNGPEIYDFDVASGTTGKHKALNTVPRPYAFTQEGTLLYPDGVSIFETNLETGESSKYMNLTGCGISSTGLQTMGTLEDGTLVGFVNSYSYIEGKSKPDLVKFIEVTEAEFDDREVITIGCTMFYGELEELALEVNRKSSDYMVEVVELTSGNSEMTYEESQNQFYTALASNTDIDMVFFSSDGMSHMLNFAKKGLLTDLTPLMEASGVVKKSDIFDNVVDACSMNGELYGLPTGMYVQTLIGKQSYVGSEAHWTVDEALELMKSKPEGTKFICDYTRDRLLTDLLELNYKKFVDLENGTCDFDNKGFKDILTLSNLCPEEMEYTESGDIPDSWEELNSGKAACDVIYPTTGDILQVFRTIFNEDATFVGFPCAEGNGTTLQFPNVITITKNAKNPQACFDIVAPLFKVKEYKSNDGIMSTMPVRKDTFTNFTESWKMEPEIDTDYVLGGELKVTPTSQEDIDAVRACVEGASGVVGSMPTEIKNIIFEEAKGFYSGEKTLDEVAPVIQSRVSMFLSETL